MQTPAQIFLSYSKRDEAKVAELYESLTREGYAVWMDIKNILPGENRRHAIDRAMRRADFFIACLSANSVNERGFVQSQFKYGLVSLSDKLETDIYLIPVRFEDCEVPNDFGDLQIADLFTLEGPSQLLAAIKIGLERRRGITGLDVQNSPTPEQYIVQGRPVPEIELTKSWEERESAVDSVVRLPLRSGGAHLSLEMESEHFIAHFSLINPRTGKTTGPDGIRDRSLVRIYLDALERTYEVMTEPPWRRKSPIVGPRGKTAVFVADGGAFTSTDLQMVPFIMLPSGNNEPNNKAEMDRAAAEAVHEAGHLFNCRERPFHDPHSAAWEWYDCALASFIETIVLPDNTNHLRFCSNWIRRPDLPLDELEIKNEGFVFIEYLRNRLGLDFVNDIWMKAAQAETPFEAMNRMLLHGPMFASAEADEDVFGSGYCLESYFFGDSSSKCYMPRVFKRYGERAVSESFLLHHGETKRIADSISHLACKYYRLRVADQSQGKQVQISLEVADSAAALKAEVAVVTTSGHRLFTQPLRKKPETGQLFTNVLLPESEIDHVILVVSNCGMRSSRKMDGHDDGKQFEIVALAV